MQIFVRIYVYMFPLQECSESCGGGQQRSTRVVEQQPSGGGEECGELGTWSLIMHLKLGYSHVLKCFFASYGRMTPPSKPGCNSRLIFISDQFL